MNITQFSIKNSVILSGGELGNFLSSQDSPEPKSKDLACPGGGWRKRHRTSLLKACFPHVASRKMVSSLREKNTRFGIHNRLTVAARSFDCGSGSSFPQAKSLCSPPLRMTDFFLMVIGKETTS